MSGSEFVVASREIWRSDIPTRTLTIARNSVFLFPAYQKHSFANDSHFPTIIKAKTYPTVEHYVQSARVSALLGSGQWTLKILRIQNVSAMRSFCQNLLDANGASMEAQNRWFHENAIDVTMVALKEKFAQDWDLAEELMRTGSQSLIQCDERESFWSVGMSANQLLQNLRGQPINAINKFVCPLFVQPELVSLFPTIGNGKNVQGMLLMALRDEMRLPKPPPASPSVPTNSICPSSNALAFNDLPACAKASSLPVDLLHLNEDVVIAVLSRLPIVDVISGTSHVCRMWFLYSQKCLRCRAPFTLEAAPENYVYLTEPNKTDSSLGRQNCVRILRPDRFAASMFVDLVGAMKLLQSQYHQLNTHLLQRMDILAFSGLRSIALCVRDNEVPSWFGSTLQPLFGQIEEFVVIPEATLAFHLTPEQINVVLRSLRQMPRLSNLQIPVPVFQSMLAEAESGHPIASSIEKIVVTKWSHNTAHQSCRQLLENFDHCFESRASLKSLSFSCHWCQIADFSSFAYLHGLEAIVVDLERSSFAAPSVASMFFSPNVKPFLTLKNLQLRADGLSVDDLVRLLSKMRKLTTVTLSFNSFLGDGWDEICGVASGVISRLAVRYELKHLPSLRSFRLRVSHHPSSVEQMHTVFACLTDILQSSHLTLKELALETLVPSKRPYPNNLAFAMANVQSLESLSIRMQMDANTFHDSVGLFLDALHTGSLRFLTINVLPSCWSANVCHVGANSAVNSVNYTLLESVLPAHCRIIEHSPTAIVVVGQKADGAVVENKYKASSNSDLKRNFWLKLI